MSKHRINVKNNEMWGRLVKAWATGRDYVGHTPTVAAPVPPEPPAGTAPKNPKPNSFADFVDQCRLAQVGLFFEDGSALGVPITGNEDMGFVLLQVTSDTAVLRLPAKEKIHESEEKLVGKPAAGGVAAVAPKDYALPQFYTDIFGTPMAQQNAAEKMVLHAQRVGEYTINTCM